MKSNAAKTLGAFALKPAGQTISDYCCRVILLTSLLASVYFIP